MDVLEALARMLNPARTITRTLLAYDSSTASSSIVLAGALKQAVRITPTLTGQLTSLNVNLTTPSGRPIVGSGPLHCEVYTSNGGAVDAKIGSTVSHPFTQLSASTYNHISMQSANITLNAGTDYFIVLSVPNVGDTVRLRTDQVTTATRSLSYSGTTWSQRTTNLRIQAIVTTTTDATGIAEQFGLPLEYELSKNYPNPFNPSTTIRFSVPTDEHVKLVIFDVLGREVATLVDEMKMAGRYQTMWNGTNVGGVPVASGAYFFRLETPNFSATERMLLLK
jgi:hypothetical protein